MTCFAYSEVRRNVMREPSAEHEPVFLLALWRGLPFEHGGGTVVTPKGGATLKAAELKLQLPTRQPVSRRESFELPVFGSVRVVSEG